MSDHWKTESYINNGTPQRRRYTEMNNIGVRKNYGGRMVFGDENHSTYVKIKNADNSNEEKDVLLFIFLK